MDGLVYELGVDEGGNPDGAIIKVDGQPLITPIEFQFIGNESIQKTITVEHPNTGQFTFEDLELYFATACQIDHSESVGFDLQNGSGFLIYDDFQSEAAANGEKEIYSRFYLPLELDVYFVEPCSPIDISFPLQNHVVTPSNENLFVTLTEYDNQDPDLDVVRLQYRLMEGDGSWINILELPASSFANDPVFKIVQWDMMELEDGAYELRAVADCSGTIGGNLSPGISEVIKVIKETEAPGLFGAPQPADGILSPGDEISITFNELINCNEVLAADGIGSNINLNNIALINTETGALVPFSHQCVGDKIIITPEVQSKFINDKVLKARATAVKDLAGNEMEVPVGGPGSSEVNYKEWEFLVDLNPLRWQAGSNISESVIEGSGLTVTRKIVNNSGTPLDYTITGPRIDNPDGSVNYGPVPVWMNVFPLNGTLEPGELKTITFNFPDDLPQNEYLSEINVVGTDGNKAIEVDYRVLCPSPIWEFDATAFTYSMNFTLELNIQGDVSEDDMDIVAAFIDGELRGKAYVEYVPSLDRYEAFLTVYSDNFLDADVTFQIWDANECALYGQVLESFPFAADELIGTPNEPQVLHTNGLILREIPLHTGWNWISFNLGFPNSDLDSVLVSLEHPENDLIKSQTAFASYIGDPLNQWIGSLIDLGNISMYQFQADVPDMISLVGTPIDYTNIEIPIQPGWNWISYLPQDALTVDEALASLTPLNGDLIKSQTAFAQYLAGFGWIGNLDFMQAPKGYLLKSTNPDILVYPDVGNFKHEIVETRTVSYSPWEVTPADFEHTMIMVGVLSEDDYNLTKEGMTLGAFVNGEVRGVAPAIYIEALGEWMFFLTIYANQSGEPLRFKLNEADDDNIFDLNEAMWFSIDGQEGTVETPIPFTLDFEVSTVESKGLENDLLVWPNPFSGITNVSFRTPDSGEAIVTMVDATGNLVKMVEIDAKTGWNSLRWEVSGLASGMYVIKIYLLLAGIIILPGVNKVKAQGPNWSVNAPSFVNSMSITAQIQVDGLPENGAENILGAFVGNELRGVASPFIIGGQAYYFLTVHSNVVTGEMLSFRVYLSDADNVLPALEEAVFVKNGQVGGFPLGFKVNVSLASDFPISLLPIPSDTTLTGIPFPEIVLENFLVTQDNDPVVWSVGTSPNLQGNINGNNGLIVTPLDPAWTGTDSLLVTVTETGTANGYFASQWIRFTVEEDYGLPVFAKMPAWFFRDYLPFPGGDLDEYVTFGGPCLEYSVELILPEDDIPTPVWPQPNTNSGSMSLVVRADFGGKAFDGSSDLLAGFVNGQLAGSASPVNVGGESLFFLTLANLGSGEVTFEFFDAEHEYLHTKAPGLAFVPAGAVGSVVDPFIVEFSPFLVEVDVEGVWTTTLLDPLWMGELQGIFSAVDCGYSQKRDSMEVTFFRVPPPEIQLLTGITDLACGSDFFFVRVDPGQNSYRQLVIRNEGLGSLNITSFAFGGDSVFTIENEPMTPFYIPPSQQEVLTLRFSPTAEQAYSGTLTILNDDEDEPGCIVNLMGTVTIPTMGQWAFFLFGLSVFTMMVVGLYNIKFKEEIR